MHVFSSEEVVDERETKLAHYQRLIEEIGLATQDLQFGQYFASLLSAMRGPDADPRAEPPEFSRDRKVRMTIPIRSVLGWRCGIIKSKAEVLKHTDWTKLKRDCRLDTNRTGNHFLYHILEAVGALRVFGLLNKAE